LKKINLTDKILNITHSDLDGVGCSIVLKNVFNDIEIKKTTYSKINSLLKSINYSLYDWVNSLQYPLAVKATRPDIIVMPLVPNNFNYSKSDIKAIESYAIGAVAVGTVFGADKGPSPYDDNLVNVPYNCTVADIEEKINWCCDMNNFNETIAKQYKKLIDEGRYLEDAKYINFLTSII
jgi:hypothetical protein